MLIKGVMISVLDMGALLRLLNTRGILLSLFRYRCPGSERETYEASYYTAIVTQLLNPVCFCMVQR